MQSETSCSSGVVSEPSDVAGLQEEGNTLFRGSRFEEAVLLYRRALDALFNSGACKGLILSLLLNSSACHLELLKPNQALKLASAAATLDPTSSKACLRAGLALDVLQLLGPANHFTRQAAEKGRSIGGTGGGSSSVSDQLSEMMERLSMAAVAATATAEQASSAIRSALYADPATLAPSNAGVGRAAIKGGSSAGDQAQIGPDADAAFASKDQGNALFEEGNFAEALRCYDTALFMLQQDCKRAAILLNNRSLCQARLGLLPSAVQDATAAVVMDPEQFKGYLRLGSALLQLEEPKSALVCVNAGLTSCPGNTDLTELKQRISAAVKVAVRAAAAANRPATAPPRASQPSTAAASGAHQQEAARGLAEEAMRASAPPGTYPTAEQTARGMMSTAQTASMNDKFAARKQAPGYSLADAPPATGWCDTRVKPFHTEFQQAGLWPAECDLPAAKLALWSCYENARVLPMLEMSIKNEYSRQDPQQHYQAQKRCKPDDPAHNQWLGTASIGDIRHAPLPAKTGEQKVLRSFSEVACQAQNYTEGTTHVAVGFLDLGGICASLRDWTKERFTAEAAQPLTPQCSSRCSVGGRWVGIDKSVYAVVKTSIIAQMLKMGADVDTILQVWYSAAWSAATLAAFRAAVTAKLALSTGGVNGNDGCSCPRCSTVSGHPEPSESQALLLHWQTADVPLAVARGKWLDVKDMAYTHSTWIGNFTRKMDRMALCSYLLTGQLGDAEVGSVVMFAIPAGAGARAQTEHFLQTIPFVELTEEMGKKSAPDVVAVGIKMLSTGISRLRTLVSQQHITLQVVCGNVGPNSEVELGFIRSLQPSSISWSNIPGDLPTAQFHKMAKSCSVADTAHTCYSTYWEKDTKGASFIDYKVASDKKAATKYLAITLKSMRETTLPNVYKVLKWDKILLCPPVDSAGGLLDFAFHIHMHEAWVEKYFKDAVPRYKQQVIITQPPVYSVLPCNLSTINILFTYSSTLIL